MIIWIASYPKSGNTWLRALLSAYLYSKDGIFNFNLLSKIDQFPRKKYFEYFMDDFNDIGKVSKHWLAAQERINLFNKNITFFKTHNALCTIEDNPFTNKENTKAAIYVVRDPRNVITSISNHYEIDANQSYDFINNMNKLLVGVNFKEDKSSVATVLGNWSEHYKSWKNIKFAPILVIKYEDLIINPKKTFLSVLKFLKNLMEINIIDTKISKTINSCSFDILSEKEKKEGFNEAVTSKKNNKKINFFNLGKKNEWKHLLDSAIEKNIRKNFNSTMNELGYTE